MINLKYCFNESLLLENVRSDNLTDQTFPCFILNVNKDDENNAIHVLSDFFRGSHRFFKNTSCVSLHYNEIYLEKEYNKFVSSSDFVIVGCFDFVDNVFIEYKQYENNFTFDEYKHFLKEIEFLHYNYCFYSTNNFNYNYDALKKNSLTLFNLNNQDDYDLSQNESINFKKIDISKIQAFLLEFMKTNEHGLLSDTELLNICQFSGYESDIPLSLTASNYVVNILRVYCFLNSYIINIKTNEFVSTVSERFHSVPLSDYINENISDLTICHGINKRWLTIFKPDTSLLKFEFLFE